MNITVRPAAPIDIPTLHAIQKEAFLPLYERYRDDNNPVNTPIERMLGWLGRENLYCYGIWLDDRLVGGVSVKKLSERQYYLTRLFVAPALQNRGIASAAIAQCEGFFPDAESWSLDFPADLDVNRHVYEKMGYRDTGETQSINERLTLAVYRKEVTPKISDLHRETYEALDTYYSRYDEEGRLLSLHGQVEYHTTMNYLHRYLQPGARILEVGAGTGRYSLALAAEGYAVTAVELIPHNLALLREKITAGMDIETYEGNALDLSFLMSGTYDMVLLLGPLYHLYNKEDKITAMEEAMRCAKPGGVLGFAHCMADATTYCYAFAQDGNGQYRIHDLMARKLITRGADGRFVLHSTPTELFELVTKADIDEYLAHFGDRAARLHFVGTDMGTNYLRPQVDAMDDDTFRLFLEYHDSICERVDLVGASHHTLDLWRKNSL